MLPFLRPLITVLLGSLLLTVLVRHDKKAAEYRCQTARPNRWMLGPTQVRLQSHALQPQVFNGESAGNPSCKFATLRRVERSADDGCRSEAHQFRVSFHVVQKCLQLFGRGSLRRTKREMVG